ncbi:MAG: PSD1 and planctomycete cytochrome C domain-containing protein [Planctomycetota bacterium]
MAEETGYSPIRFEKEVVPVLVKRCLGCHNASEKQGELELSTIAGIQKGGEGGPALVAGNPGESHLLLRAEAGEMPPEKDGKSNKLPESEIELLRQWIAAGAPWPEGRTLSPYEVSTSARAGFDWWSLQPIQGPLVPTVKTVERVSNPIDAFVLATLEKENMTLAPEADRRVLIRRLYADFLGLPPRYSEVEAFANDPSADAYERLVDRLLASPHFGERWARYWLDVARYAETCGYERDQEKPGAWKYRDWVIQAINDDMPYDQFVSEQLAGDELPGRTESQVIATGFLRMGTWNDEPNDALEYKYERLEDLVHVTSTAFLGLTVKCARCHDHKFDPIPQTDYYRMAAIFWAGHVEPRDAALLGGPTKEELGFDVFGYTDRAKDPPPMQLLRKGDPHRPEQVVAPGYLSLVPALDQSMAGPSAEATTSQRRLQLAKWLTDGRHPLTARVAVNRLWQHHFGEGLVRTPDNFGFNGERPTHPELLDWLATEFRAGGWRAKRLHKLMVMSQVYRQSSVHPEGATYHNRDAGNRLWWHAERRRRDAESLRDAMLAVSGRLDEKIGGPGFKAQISDDALEGLSMKMAAWKASPPEEQNRRSIYMFCKRSLLSPMMTVFDFCDTSQPCARRDVTTVAPQALTLLNNGFVHQVSQDLAQCVRRDAGEDRHAQIDEAWKRCLGRLPNDRERSASARHMEAQELNRASSPAGDSLNQDARGFALASLCHVLINANEFIYVD